MPGAHTSAMAAQLLWLLLGAGACISCQADDHIDTDGPDFVDSSEVVGKRRFQFEANLEYQQQKTGATHQQLIGTPTLLRLGLADSVEARVQIGGWQWLQTRDPSMPAQVQSCWADTAIGAKWHFLSPDSEERPPACLIFQVETSSGSDPFRGRGYRPSLRSVITWDLTETVSASIMPGGA
jgi:Putative MetA-pathway of phenol degradation